MKNVWIILRIVQYINNNHIDFKLLLLVNFCVRNIKVFESKEKKIKTSRDSVTQIAEFKAKIKGGQIKQNL